MADINFLNENLAAMLTLISAATGAAVSIINAIKSRSTHKKINEVDNKVDTVKQQTNGDRDRLLLEIRKRDVALQEQQLMLMKKDIEMSFYNRRSTDYQPTATAPVIKKEDTEPKE